MLTPVLLYKKGVKGGEVYIGVFSCCILKFLCNRSILNKHPVPITTYKRVSEL